MKSNKPNGMTKCLDYLLSKAEQEETNDKENFTPLPPPGISCSPKFRETHNLPET